MENLKNKQTLRKLLKKARGSIPHPRKDKIGFASFFRLRHLASENPTLSYAPINDEVNLWPLNHYLMKSKKLYLPKVHGTKLKVYLVTETKQLTLSSKKILEPNDQAEEVSPVVLKNAFIPGLGFDHNLHRLGYGLGYYDQFLAEYPHIHTYGILYNEQLITDTLPESHDVAMQELIIV